MLKSLSTQIAATLFFGPLGLAYSSVAAAVFLTLVLAVLLFTDVGILAVLAVWPLSILTGMVFVKLHNDQIRSSGSRLLLGPSGEYEGSPLAAWGRGAAVLALILVAGFVAYLYLPSNGGGIGRIVDSAGSTPENNPVEKVKESVAVAEITPSNTAVIAANSNNQNNSDNFAVIALPEREIASVIIDGDGNVSQGEAGSALNSGRPELTVDASVVNLRRGPGTSFDILTTVEGGDRLFEYARDGNWINVETESGGFTGWIYKELVR